MKVRIKKTGQILNLEYDDDDLYKGWDGGAVWFYANEFDIIDEEESDNKPLFTLTSEEVEYVKNDLEFTKLVRAAPLTEFENNLLTRINQYYENNRTT